ncbi:hypothetical protein CSKR_111033 [Clonorchis sinensis]|uniref:Uncharacterized protein n=1 Tax=Clonorchis sinensis TaxID=79923 RepID=A0A419PJZ3_CLOSI|nr:hypothetical protein CSKR_111033 [Clonorchis sinensis]
MPLVYHPTLESVFLNFPGCSLTVTQVKANATQRLNRFRNRFHFSRSAKRIYEKTYYSHATSVVSTVTPLCQLNGTTGISSVQQQQTENNSALLLISRIKDLGRNHRRWAKNQCFWRSGEDTDAPWCNAKVRPFLQEVPTTRRGFHPSRMLPDLQGGMHPSSHKCGLCIFKELQIPDILSGRRKAGLVKQLSHFEQANGKQLLRKTSLGGGT